MDRRTLFTILGLLLFAGPLAARETPGTGTIELRQARKHPMRYWLALPEGYTREPGKKWPVLVVLPGKADPTAPGDAFEETIKAYASARGSGQVIVVVPITFLNNDHELPPALQTRYRSYYGKMVLPRGEDRLTWDEAGLFAVRRDLLADLDAEERFYLTGFSAGGMLGYHLILAHPNLLAGAVMMCANFRDWVGYADQPRPRPEDVRFPVRIILGENDPLRHLPIRTHRERLKDALLGAGLLACIAMPLWYWTRRWRRSLALMVAGLLMGPGIGQWGEKVDWSNETQSAEAEALMHTFGYSDVQTTLQPGMGHDPSPQRVFEAFQAVWVRLPDLSSQPSHSSRGHLIGIYTSSRPWTLPLKEAVFTPSPLMGVGWGGGDAPARDLPPTPTLPHKGGGRKRLLSF